MVGIEAVVSMLVAAQNPDGGWGWKAGTRSGTECTSLAVLSLASFDAVGQTIAVGRGLAWLAARQNPDASWPLNAAVSEPSWATALVMIALYHWPEYHGRVIKAAHWVMAQHGNKPGILAKIWVLLSMKSPPVTLNEGLIGWSWTPGAFSWVEPTSYFLIVLNQNRPRLAGTGVDERIRQGEEMIYDRMCKGGGWNYGNSVVYGENLWPYADVTAVALIALQRNRNAAKNLTSLDALEQLTQDVDSGLALAWSAICFELYGRDPIGLRRRLMKTFESTRFLDEVKPLALAILALTGGAKYFSYRDHNEPSAIS